MSMARAIVRFNVHSAPETHGPSALFFVIDAYGALPSDLYRDVTRSIGAIVRVTPLVS